MGENELFGLAGIAATAALKSRLLKGAQRGPNPAPATNIYKLDGTSLAVDNRVRIILPIGFPLMGQRLSPPGAVTRIFFPYTPSITFDHKATYAAQTVMHSNFTQYFYQNSSVSPITISGKYTIEKQSDAEELLDTIHAFRTLTKMITGKGIDAGSPPPVCLLKAYGPYMLDNVPIVISSFKHELPENVDYYTIKGDNTVAKDNTLPIVSTITIICNPVYSRTEMKAFNTFEYGQGKFNVHGNVKGYL